MKKTTIVTLPPFAPYAQEVVRHPCVEGIRLNTVMPIKGKLEDTLSRLADITKEAEKSLWIDLKCRQLRIKSYGVPPFTEIELSHNIEVYTPCDAYFSGREEKARILEVDGNKLIMLDGPRRVIGPGESVTIPHPTLRIEGYLTERDKEYIEAAQKVGIKTFMLSFVEHQSDIEALLAYASDADIIAKIESQKGLDYVRRNYKGDFRLMAARGDLFMELHWPHTIIDALELIVVKDQMAIAASRIFDSLATFAEPSCADIGDFDNLIRMGYKRTMLGDELCLRRESVMAALNLFRAMTKYHEDKKGDDSNSHTFKKPYSEVIK